MKLMKEINELKQSIKGDVWDSIAQRSVYSTDASVYQIQPTVVVLPRDEKDMLEAVTWASKYQFSITARGAGTSLAGQTVGSGMILDCSKYMNKVLEINAKEKWALVQPGLIRDELNRESAKYKLHFAPDPATSSRATVGGMIANNSSGTKSIVFGKTIDHVLELKVLLADGSICHWKKLDHTNAELEIKTKSTTGRILKGVTEIIKPIQSVIDLRYPKVMRRVSGYMLDEVIDNEGIDLCKLICASEGTLALILEAKIHLEDVPAHKAVCMLHFNSMYEAMNAVQEIIKTKPSAVEMLDRKVVQLAKKNIITREYTKVIQDEPAAVLMVDYNENDPSIIEEKLENLFQMMKGQESLYAQPIYRDQLYEACWALRKKGLGILLSVTSDEKPLPFIEDSCVPLENLADYIQGIIRFCESIGIDCAVYAHASVGVIHIRPMLDLRKVEHIEKFKKISQYAYGEVVKYGGAWSGEHGDGLVRSYKNKEFFGEEIYTAFRQIKQLLDPQNILNPGKIVDSPAIDQSLRYGSNYHDMPTKNFYKFRETGSFQAAVHMCSGVGECRKIGSGTMCPSYMATREEIDSTRGRANILRLAMSGQIAEGDLTSQEVMEAMDLCLSCKACKAECPSSVDMAKLKSEALQMKHDKDGIDLKGKLTAANHVLAKRFSGPLAGVINSVQKSTLFKSVQEKLFKLDSRRTLPLYASQSLASWYKQNQLQVKNPQDTVLLFADTYINYFEPESGKHLIKILNACNIQVELLDVGCCQRPLLSNGFLRKGKAGALSMLEKLEPYLKSGNAIIVCEPSCASALLDDIPDLIDDIELGKQLKEQVLPVEQYLLQIAKKGLMEDKIHLKSDQFLLHGHCHQKALFGTTAISQLIDLIDENAFCEIMDSGCCGMAGTFGYEKKHYEISKQIGERVLLPAVRAADQETEIIANGFSCRHQIEHFTERAAMHFLHMLEVK